MALTVKGTLKFGIGSAGLAAPTGAAVSDISAITSADVTKEYTVNASARNADGETVAHVYGDAKATLRVEGFHTAAAIPTLGAALTVAGETGTVQKATIGASNQDFVKLSIEGEKFNGVTY